MSNWTLRIHYLKFNVKIIYYSSSKYTSKLWATIHVHGFGGANRVAGNFYKVLIVVLEIVPLTV